MDRQERRMFYAMAFYVFLDSVGKIIDFVERFIPEGAL